MKFISLKYFISGLLINKDLLMIFFSSSWEDIKSFKSTVYFTPAAYLNLDTKFSLKVIELYLDFIKRTVGKLVSHTRCSKHT